jgi:dihydrofolate synthase / folylpolyglutamate synthase
MSSAIDSATRDYLVGLKRRGVALGLDRMWAWVAALDNPQTKVPVIHIAGTNGKGSVAAMVDAILREAGWRTGLYTSPHLVRLGERVQVNRDPLTNDELAAYVRELREVVDQLVACNGESARPSYFEFMTAVAFLHFVRKKCDMAIVEVGMGGRLDATNVVDPTVSAITSIGFDHTEFLGHTIEAIAAEKAGIIKPQRPVVIGRLPVEAERVVRAVATTQGSPVAAVAESFGEQVDRLPQTNLAGDYQRLNAATAKLVVQQLGSAWRIRDQTIDRALMQVSWPARWQRFDLGGRTVVVDASHNAEGATALDENLSRLSETSGQRPIIVVGVLGEARARPLLEVVFRHAADVRLVVPNQNRACRFEQLEALAPKPAGVPVGRSTIEAIFPHAGTCLPNEPIDRPVVVTGSIYLAGEVLARIDPKSGPVEYDLQDF